MSVGVYSWLFCRGGYWCSSLYRLSYSTIAKQERRLHIAWFDWPLHTLLQTGRNLQTHTTFLMRPYWHTVSTVWHNSVPHTEYDLPHKSSEALSRNCKMWSEHWEMLSKKSKNPMWPWESVDVDLPRKVFCK